MNTLIEYALLPMPNPNLVHDSTCLLVILHSINWPGVYTVAIVYILNYVMKVQTNLVMGLTHYEILK